MGLKAPVVSYFLTQSKLPADLCADLPQKRPLMPAVQLTSQIQVQTQSSSSGSSASPVGLFSEPSSSSTEPATSDQGPSAPSWPTQTTEPEAPTPSLCSDNDPERDDEHDQPPSTPPPMFPSRNMYRFRGTGIPVSPSERSRSSIQNKSLFLRVQERKQEREHEHEHEPEQGQAQVQETPQHVDQHADYEDSFVPIHPVTPEDPTKTNSESTIFEKKRLPVSPLPNKSPRKPHPPGRRRSTPHPKKLLLPPDHHEDQEPPPVLTFATPPVAISTPAPAAQAPPKPSSDTPDVFNESRAPRPRPPPSRIPVPSTRLRTTSYKLPSAPKAQPRRRLTLGEELWIAQQSDELNGDNEDEPDDGLYVGTGMRSRNQSFLAHGGAGGTPVIMETGYVEGEEKEGSPEAHQDLIGKG